jgi:hypothetical protein
MSYNPNANSFTPGGGGGAPPFRPGQPYNPYGQQQQPGQQPGDQQQGQQGQQSYNQGYQQQQGNYGKTAGLFIHLFFAFSILVEVLLAGDH